MLEYIFGHPALTRLDLLGIYLCAYAYGAGKLNLWQFALALIGCVIVSTGLELAWRLA